MANQNGDVASVPDTTLQEILQDDPQLTMQFIASFWDSLTHCAAPTGYDEVTQKLQGALNDATVQAASTAEVAPNTAATQEATAIGPKQIEWESLGVYRITLDNSGSPVPDPDWPAEFRFVQNTSPEGNEYFQLFQTERDAMTIDTTDKTATVYAVPELSLGSDDDPDHYVYRFNRRYRFGPKANDAQGKYLSKPFQELEYFNYAEHLILGNKVQLQWSDTETISASRRPLKLENGNELTYGEINALGGDFFGTINPICTGATFQAQCTLFMKAFETLSKSPRAVKEVQDIKVIEQSEMNAIGGATHDGTTTADTGTIYAKLDQTDNKNQIENKKLDDATRRSTDPSYMALSQLNFDHFGLDGHTAYNAGHYCAMQAAANGNLELAYSMNAFADHFLGDAFASGHFRVPRRKLHGSSDNIQAAVDTISRIVLGNSTAGMIAQLTLEILKPSSSVTKAFDTCAPDFCSKYMHEEDNVLGLWLTNKRGDQWQAFGDTKMFDPANAVNCKFMLQALNLSASEVYAAYKNRPAAAPSDPSQFGVWNIAPTAEVSGRNSQPLFNKDGWYRWPLENPKSTEYYNPTDSSIFATGFKRLAIDLFRSTYFSNLK